MLSHAKGLYHLATRLRARKISLMVLNENLLPVDPRNSRRVVFYELGFTTPVPIRAVHDLQ